MVKFPSFVAQQRISPLSQSAAIDYTMYSNIKTQAALGKGKPAVQKGNILATVLARRGSINQDIALKRTIAADNSNIYSLTDLIGYPDNIKPKCGSYNGYSSTFEYDYGNYTEANAIYIADPINYATCLQQTMNAKYSSGYNAYGIPKWNVSTVNGSTALCPSLSALNSSYKYDNQPFVTNCDCGGAFNGQFGNVPSAFPCD